MIDPWVLLCSTSCTGLKQVHNHLGRCGLKWGATLHKNYFIRTIHDEIQVDDIRTIHDEIQVDDIGFNFHVYLTDYFHVILMNYFHFNPVSLAPTLTFFQ